MAKATLAVQFQLETKREVVESVGREYAASAVPSGWYLLAPPTGVPAHASKAYLLCLRPLVTARSLHMALKQGTTPRSGNTGVYASKTTIRKPTAEFHTPITPKAPSTSLQSIPASTRLLNRVKEARQGNSTPTSFPPLGRIDDLNSQSSMDHEWASDDDERLLLASSGTGTPPLPED